MKKRKIGTPAFLESRSATASSTKKTYLRCIPPCFAVCLSFYGSFCWLYYVTTVTPFVRRSEGSGHFDLAGSWTSRYKNAVFFAEIQIRCKVFQLQPNRETSSSSLGDRLQKCFIFPHQIKPFVPDFEARLAFVQTLWTLLRLFPPWHPSCKCCHPGEVSW